ncbi:MAG: hypothetical protein KAS32_01470 [Candidatus Peribacteraceae bacterium]|nr:hypothetical protein [Candidatus Peribacteraceae bacterium]
MKNSAVIVTQSGREVNVLNPTSEMICLEDAAYALSNLCRYTGHCNPAYSVAEHCVHCSYIPEDIQLQRACLLHDLAESLINDLSSPLKEVLPKYKEIEENILCVVFSKYGLNSIAPWDIRIKEVDMAMLRIEINELMPKSKAFDSVYETYPVLETPPPIQCWPAKYAEKMFLQRAEQLGLTD